MKAVIVEIKNRQAAVMTKDGRFIALDLDQLKSEGLIPEDAALPEDALKGLIGREILLPDSLVIPEEDDEDDLSEEELFDTEYLEEMPESAKTETEAQLPEAPAEAPAENHKAPEEETGRVIPIRKRSRFKLRSFQKAAAAAAAAVVLTVTVGGAYTYAQPYGVVSIDADNESGTSLQYTINRFDRVIAAEAVSGDGTGLPEGFDVKTVRNKKIGDAISTALGQIGETELLVVGASTRSEEHSKRLKADLEKELSPRFDENKGELYLAIASDEEAAEAREIGTTPGRLLYAGKMLGGDAATPETAPEAKTPVDTAETAAGSVQDPGEDPAAVPGAQVPGEWTEWARRPVKEIRREHERRLDLMQQGGPGAGPEAGPMGNMPGSGQEGNAAGFEQESSFSPEMNDPVNGSEPPDMQNAPAAGAENVPAPSFPQSGEAPAPSFAEPGEAPAPSFAEPEDMGASSFAGAKEGAAPAGAPGNVPEAADQGNAPEMSPGGGNPPEGTGEMNLPGAQEGGGSFGTGSAPSDMQGNAPEMNPGGGNPKGGSGGMNDSKGAGGGKPF